MATIPISFPGGGGGSSDDVTASKAQVLAGYTAITTDSDDEPMEGTMPNKGGTSSSWKNYQTDSLLELAANDWIRMRIPAVGYYNTYSYVYALRGEFGDAAASDVLASKTFTSSAGLKKTGSISSKAAATYNVAASDRTIAAGQYLSGAQTIKAVTTANISAANIKKGVVVKVGDANDDDRLVNVTGTYTTISSGQTAVVAGAMLSGYSGFANGGSEVKGTITSKAAATYNTSSSDRTIDAAQYLSGAQTIKAVTTENISAANIKKGVVVKVGDTNSAGRIKNITGTYTTVSDGQTALAASTLLTGYSGFANGGSEVQGTMAHKGGTSSAVKEWTATVDANTNSSLIRMKIPANGYYNGYAYLTAAYSTFGNATAAQVLKDKTFTSSAGFKATGTIETQAAKTVYATTSDQTAVAAGKYCSGAITVKKLTQTNLAAANILRGKTITINNGSANVWSVTGSNSVLKIISGSATLGTTAISIPNDSGTNYTAYYASVNPGITPVYCLTISDRLYLWHNITGNAGNLCSSNPAKQTEISASQNVNSVLPASSTSVRLPGSPSRGAVWYFIMGY